MNPPLTLPPDEMRRIGYRVVDLLVYHFDRIRDEPAGRKADPRELKAALRQPCPEQGASFDAALEELERTVLDYRMRVDHPRFFGFVPSPSNFVGAMADALAAGLNVFAGSWTGGSGAAALELVVIDWIRQWCGMPETAGGLFLSGGSMANLTALAAARHAVLEDRVDGAVVYFSDQMHSSVERALAVLGFRKDQLRRLPADTRCRLDPARVAAAVAADRASGRRPFAIVASAGTVSTGAVDPLPALGDLCAREKLWLHVDGAYGAAAVITERGRRELSGIARADSLSLDPHKWLFQPYEAGCVLVRDRQVLVEAFQHKAAYLKELYLDPEEVNFCDLGIQLTRTFRALKVWLSLQVFGLDQFRQAVERGFELADAAERRIRQSEVFEVVSPAQMGIVAFRHRRDDGLHAGLVERLMASGFAMLTSTEIGGRSALRLCTINPRTTDADIDATLSRLEQLAETESAPAA